MQTHAIRVIDPTDSDEELDALIEAYLLIFNEPATLKVTSFSLRPFDAETMRDWFLDAGCRCLLCDDDQGRIIGFQILVPSPLTGCELWGAGVMPKMRRKGIGRALVAEAVRFATDLGYKALDSLVFADNVPRLQLLLGMGFLPVAMKYHARADGGDLVRMRRLL